MIMSRHQSFIHHVFFWLKKSKNQEDQAKLVAGLEKLRDISDITGFHIGIPAITDRPVIDSSYDISLGIFFDIPEAQDAYQIDPLHLAFIDECKHLWERVVVYDSIDI